MNPSILARALLGQSADDWYVPNERAYPHTTDRPAEPPALSLGPLPDVAPGSAYSPSRNAWRDQGGALTDAGAFRPLPPDANTYDPQYLYDQYFRGPAFLWNP